MVFHAPRMESHGSARFTEPVRGLFDGGGWDSGDFTGAAWVPRLDGLGYLFKSGRVLVDEHTIFEMIAKDDVEHAGKHRDIRARAHRKVEVGIAGDGRHTGIGDDQASSVVAHAPEVVGGDGETF